MRVIILAIFTLLAAGIFTAMFMSIWSARCSADRASDYRQGVVAEFVWAVIPCLILIAAAIPAAIEIIEQEKRPEVANRLLAFSARP